AAGTPFTAILAGNGSGQLEGVQVVALPTGADTATITINGTPITVTGPLASATAVRDALVTAINANVTVNGAVTAVADPNHAAQLLIQSDTGLGTFTIAFAGTSAPTSASSDGPSAAAVTTPNTAPVAQTDTLTLGGTVGPGEIGDTYTLTVGTQSIAYVADGPANKLRELRHALR